MYLLPWFASALLCITPAMLACVGQWWRIHYIIYMAIYNVILLKGYIVTNEQHYYNAVIGDIYQMRWCIVDQAARSKLHLMIRKYLINRYIWQKAKTLHSEWSTRSWWAKTETRRLHVYTSNIICLFSLQAKWIGLMFIHLECNVVHLRVIKRRDSTSFIWITKCYKT